MYVISTKYSARQDAEEFFRCVDKEIEKGWMLAPATSTPTIPFRVIPGSIVPKNGTTEGAGLVWNASWTLYKAYTGVILTPSGQWVEVSENSHSRLPQSTDLEWATIEENCETIEIIADGAITARLPLQTRIFDVKSWSRQLAIDDRDASKQVFHVRGGLRKDLRWQMGSSAASHNVQRLTILLGRLVMKVVIEEGWGIEYGYTLNS